jgi:hypothetical protein
MRALFARLTGFYLASWLVLAWSVLWFVAGAVVTYAAACRRVFPAAVTTVAEHRPGFDGRS